MGIDIIGRRVIPGVSGTRWLAAVLLLQASACNFVQIVRGGYADRFRAAGLSERKVRLADDTLVYWEGGSGAPILLIEGYGPDSLFHWNQQVEALSPGHRLIVPDLLWCGASVTTRSEVGTLQQAQALVALLDHLGIERVDAIGQSYGGIVAWALAAYYPERVRRLVMIDSPGDTYTVEDYAALLARHRVSHGADLFVPTDGDDVKRLLSLAYMHPIWAPGFVRKQVVHELYGQHRSEMRGLMDAALVELGRPDRFPTPMAPLLLIWGDQDPVFPPELAQRVLARVGASAVLHVIPDSHHAPNLEYPDLVNPLIRAFLADDAP